MLRSEHSILHFDFVTMTVHPDRLLRQRDMSYVAALQDCITGYENGSGRERQDLHCEVRTRLEQIVGCPPRRIASFCKLLDEHAIFRSDPKAAVALRQRLFKAAASLHPIVINAEGVFDHDLLSSRRQICEELHTTWDQIEKNLFADVIELQQLKSFESNLQATDILSQYNVAQTQAALYQATRIRIDAFADFKTIVSHAKLARLMHRIERIEKPRSGYRFIFDGPSSTLRTTSRYGVGFAQLLPTLLRCKDWRLRAEVLGPGRQSFHLLVSPADGLIGNAELPDCFDSDLERSVMEIWNKSPVAGWKMHHESELLVRGQTVLTPDFALRHDDGRLIHLEVVGFWTPEYLAEKSRRLAKFIDQDNNARWLLLFPKTQAERALQFSTSLSVPYVLFNKKSKPVDWIIE